jgi:hypothetical protein
VLYFRISIKKKEKDRANTAGSPKVAYSPLLDTKGKLGQIASAGIAQEFMKKTGLDECEL